MHSVVLHRVSALHPKWHNNEQAKMQKTRMKL